MGISDYVPTPAAQQVRTYSSPPWRPGSWVADRPGDLGGPQPEGTQLGSPGPDQGYALTLAETLRGELKLQKGEHAADVISGAAAVASKRSGLLGRAPVIHDVRVGLGVWGFLDIAPPKDLVALRSAMFADVHHPHQYQNRRAIADAVSADVLVQPHGVILSQSAADWRSAISV